MLELAHRTIPHLLRSAAERAPQSAFLRSGTQSRSYGEVDSRAASIAQGLWRLGVTRFSKVALMLRNSFEFVECWMGVAKLGAIYVPINTEYKGDILEYQLNRADVTHIFVDADLLGRILVLQATLPKLRALIVVPRESVAEHDSLQPKVTLSVLPLGEVASAPAREPATVVDYRDPHAISFTSGTTGPSKGVLASHCHTVTFALDWIEACAFTGTDKLYTCLPMFHAIAAWLGVLPAVICCTEISFAERFSASRFWEDVRRYQSTVVHGIFSMIPMLLKQPARADDADVPARLFYIGQRNPEFERRFNCRIVEVYGATETGIVTYTPLDESGVPGSCGRENRRTYEVALVDETDNPVPVGAVGEIVVRPRQPYSMICEYYGMPEATLSAFRNLWFHTGDNARIDADGYFTFADRKKDAIRRRGENISSFELERALIGDPRIFECAAVAVPSELAEDEVKMVIVCQPGAAISAEQVWALCEERMPRFWVPRFIEFRDSLPKTPNGKVQKYLLREATAHAAHFDRELQRTAGKRPA